MKNRKYKKKLGPPWKIKKLRGKQTWRLELQANMAKAKGKRRATKQTNKRKQVCGKVAGNTNALSKLVVGLLTDKGLDSKEGHEADRVGGLGKSKALVEVEATDHADGGDIVVTQETENKLSSVSSNY